MELSVNARNLLLRTLLVASFEAVMYVIGDAVAKSDGFILGILIVFVANALIYLMMSLGYKV